MAALATAAGAGVVVAPTAGASTPHTTGPTGPVVRDGAAQPVFSDRAGEWTVKEAWVEVPVDSDRDGRNDRVHVRYARATAATGKLPVIMHASPYFTGVNDVPNHNVDHDLYDPGARSIWTSSPGGARPTAVQLLDPWTSKRWIPRGFAWMEVESLGTGGSTGCPTTGGVNETLGVKAVIDWLNGRATAVDAAGKAVRASFANGNVGMVGTSYDGTLPNAVAATGVDGLKAIIPTSAISDWYGYYRAGGAVVAPEGYQGEDADVLAKFVLTRANPAICRPVIADLARAQDRLTGDLNNFWQGRSYLADVAKVKAAVYVAHGLSDWNVKPSQAGLWYRALRAQGTPAKVYWHQGGHGGEPPVNAQVRWFTRYVLGIRNGVDSEPRALIESPTGINKAYAEWPVPGVRNRSMSFSSFILRAGTPKARMTFADDPRQTLTSFTNAPRRATGLAYESFPIEKATRLSGFPTATLKVSLAQPNANLTVGILDIDKAGRATLVTQGWADPQKRRSLWRTDPITPGAVMTVKVRLEATDHVFAPGHSLALTILQSDHDFTIRPPAGKQVQVDVTRSGITLPLDRPLP